MALHWMFLLLLSPLLAAQNYGMPYPNNYGKRQEGEGCYKPQWDSRLRFTPDQWFYRLNEEVTVRCFMNTPPLATIRCTKGISPGWKKAWEAKDIRGTWDILTESLNCTMAQKCSKPQWDERLQFPGNKNKYQQNKELTLTCPEGLQLSFPKVKCTKELQEVSSGKPLYDDVWWVKNSTGAWTRIEKDIVCMEICQRPPWDSRLQLAPDKENYEKDEKVMLSCPEGFQPSFTEIKCQSELQYDSYGVHEYRLLWKAKDIHDGWIQISEVKCIEICQRPQWDSRLQLAPDQENYKKNQQVILSCPGGFQPRFTHVKCGSQVQSFTNGKPVHREVWTGKDSRGIWVYIPSSVECIEAIQVDHETFEISSTSIKLKWTCRFPDACQGMRAKCQLAVPPSTSCEAEEVKVEEILHGQEGTFTCSPLQPFTEYVVVFDMPHSTVIYRKHERTKETVPDKPEKLWLDPDRGSLRWKALPPCKGEIIRYELSITARNAGDSSMLEHTRLWLNGSVTEYRLAEYSPGTSYAVTMRAQTAAGAGPVLVREFQLSSSDTAQPLGIHCRSVRDIAPSQGTAVLPLRPIALPSEASMEHGLLVVPTHNTSVIESICTGQPPFLNISMYWAAIFNLTAPMNFVLGDGSRGREYHNAALHTGWDYTAVLVRPSSQLQKVICVCYSFSLVSGQAASQQHGIVIGLVVLLAVLLVAAVILWLVLSRKRKYLPNNTKEDN